MISQKTQKLKYLALGPRSVSGRQDFISDTTSPQSMILYTNNIRRKFASGDSRTLTVRAVKKGGITSAQIEASP